MGATAQVLRDAAVPEGFDVTVITAGRPARKVTLPVGSTIGDLAELAGAGDRVRPTALVGTGELVDATYVLTPADERVSFVQRLAGAGRGARARNR